ncbi:MAG: hypothetical protein Tsb0013_19700 [Phycisphaerales bacterium]
MITPSAIAVSLSGLPELSASTLRSTIDRVAGLGLRAVALSANASGLRPRELGRSARRDLAATLRRADLTCAGVDLFVPARHLGDPVHSDRAVEAYIEAIGFAADLAELAGAPAVLTTALPRRDEAQHALVTIADAADRRAVRLADLSWPPHDHAPPAFAPGFDPASVLRSADDDASTLAARYAKRLACARLSDADDAGRCPVGDGRLDTIGYLLSLSAGGYDGPVTIDVRALKDPWRGVDVALRATRELPTPGLDAGRSS